MTLLVAVATPKLAILAADRRLTYYDGRKVVGASTKLTFVHCSDARVGIAYTGLAFDESLRFKTEDWILESLDIKDGRIALDEVVEHLRRAVDREFGSPRFVGANARLTLLFCGFRAGSQPVPIITTLSTFANGGQPGSCSRQDAAAINGVMSCDAGTIRARPRALNNVVRFLVTEEIEAALDSARAAIASASRTPASKGRIGEEVNVGWLSSEGSSLQALYMGARGANVSYHPNVAMLMSGGALLTKGATTSQNVAEPSAPFVTSMRTVERKAVTAHDLPESMIVQGRHRLAFPPASCNERYEASTRARLFVLGRERPVGEYKPFSRSTIAFFGFRLPVEHEGEALIPDCWVYVLPIDAEAALRRVKPRLRRDWPPRTATREWRVLQDRRAETELWRYEHDGRVIQRACLSGNVLTWSHGERRTNPQLEAPPPQVLGLLLLGVKDSGIYAGYSFVNENERHVCCEGDG